MEKLQDKLSERLAIVSMMLSRVENPKFALSPQEIFEVLLDFGTLLKNQTRESVKNSPDVFEDPKGRSDALGNVRMIHKNTLTLVDIENFQTLGDQLLDVAHEYSKVTHYQKRYNIQLEEAEKFLDDQDKVEMDTVLGAKKKIRGLEMKLGSLKRANRNLFLKNQRIEKLLRKRSNSSPQKS